MQQVKNQSKMYFVYPQVQLQRFGLQTEHQVYFKAKVDRAIKANKIFWLYFELPALCESLESRGWVRKCSNTFDADAEETGFYNPNSFCQNVVNTNFSLVTKSKDLQKL
ncbi:hypothetical protein XENTR_v10012850 [Xenopus tropicalis]|nr:hypothetical protein XENTR_v10012850 [Xenopus tropicalis]